jgi:hypothetical protein
MKDYKLKQRNLRASFCFFFLLEFTNPFFFPLDEHRCANEHRCAVDEHRCAKVEPELNLNG